MLLNAICENIQANHHGSWEFTVTIWCEVKDKPALALLLAGEQMARLLVGLRPWEPPMAAGWEFLRAQHLPRS